MKSKMIRSANGLPPVARVTLCGSIRKAFPSSELSEVFELVDKYDKLNFDAASIYRMAARDLRERGREEVSK